MCDLIVSHQASQRNAERAKTVVLPACPFFASLGYGFDLPGYTITSHPDKKDIMRRSWSRISVNEMVHHKWSAREAEANALSEEDIATIRKLEHPNLIGSFAPLEALFNSPTFREHFGTLKGIILRQLNDHGPFPASKIVKVARDLAFALEYLHHEARYIHGDVQSSNVIVEGDFERVVLADFRVALKMDGDMTAPAAHYHATKAWCPKEVLKKRDVKISHKAEMFAYGITLYEMLALEFPHLDASLSDDRHDEDGYDTDDLDSTPPPFLLPGGGLVHIEVLEEYGLFRRFGSRPQIPWMFAEIYVKDRAYHSAVTAFYLCTTAGLSGRPSAEHMAAYFRTLDDVRGEEAATE